ncbi:hypothetical protein NKH55_01805 [Mesorhizobium opportunistum]|uniref:hypothetical protein n=1 Tax=Mesorhizobium opportunistum TaxID=593909 RepID=UPI0033399871
MARPKLGKGDSERLQMVISREELDAIEDWQHNNRIPSKSEAIRRLCQIGYSMETVIPNATDHADDMLSAVRLFYYYLVRSMALLEDGGKVDTEELRGLTEDLLDRAEDIHLILMRENNRIVPLTSRRGFKKAIAESIESESEMTHFINVYLEGGEELRESTLMREVLAEMTPDDRAYYRTLDPNRQIHFWRVRVGAKRVSLFRQKEDT